MIIPINKKMSSAMGAKTARSCDYCLRKRARWYCAADDAFLCQACDSSVHSANSLARRHERVRLKASSSLKLPKLTNSAKPSVPSWHRGLTRKARTPRHGKQAGYRHQTASEAKSDDLTQQYPNHPLVPELGADDSYSLDGNEEEQLLYRVPIYDPFVAEFHVSTPSNEATSPTNAAAADADLTAKPDHTKAAELISPHIDHRDELRDGSDDINYCFLPSEMDLAEFAADVETLLGKGLDQETYTIEELGLLDDDVREENNGAILEGYNSMSSRPSGCVVKAEGNNREAMTMVACHAATETVDRVIREPFELSFDYDDSPTTCEEEDVKAMIAGGQAESSAKERQHIELAARSLHKDDNREEKEKEKQKKGKKISLKLDYEAIRAAWGDQGPPWMNGERPEIDPDDGWPHGTVSCGTEVHQQPYGPGMGMVGGGGEQGSTAGGGDGGREARVSRYREKRRTRLFSKKIRYEVRKLNAEKRPRMKGRFVKRSSFAPAGLPILGK